MEPSTALANRPGFRGAAALLLSGAVALSIQPVSAQKKGVGLWGNRNIAAPIAEMKLGWYYNWGTGIPVSGSSAAFVPMIWGAADVTDQNLARAKSAGPVLLGFNEPDGTGGSHQANVTVERSLELWPRLVATGMRLGSPGPAANPSPSGSWLERFMKGAQEKNLRVDFICLHWYGYRFETQAALNDLRQFLVAAHQKFNRPIWLTEYALIAWGRDPMFPTLEQQAAFASASARMMDSMAFVERYAWFSLHRYGQVGAGATENSFLYDGAVATAVGHAYGSVLSSAKGPGRPAGGYSLLLDGVRYTLPAPARRARTLEVSGRRIGEVNIRQGLSPDWVVGDGGRGGNGVGRPMAPGLRILEVKHDRGIAAFPLPPVRARNP